MTPRDGRQYYIYLNSCLPIYLLKFNDEQQSKYSFFQLIDNTSVGRQRKSPCPTMDTHIIKAARIHQLLKKFDVVPVDEYASFNDIIAVRISLLKYLKC